MHNVVNTQKKEICKLWCVLDRALKSYLTIFEVSLEVFLDRFRCQKTIIICSCRFLLQNKNEINLTYDEIWISVLSDISFLRKKGNLHILWEFNIALKSYLTIFEVCLEVFFDGFCRQVVEVEPGALPSVVNPLVPLTICVIKKKAVVGRVNIGCLVVVDFDCGEWSANELIPRSFLTNSNRLCAEQNCKVFLFWFINRYSKEDFHSGFSRGKSSIVVQSTN